MTGVVHGDIIERVARAIAAMEGGRADLWTAYVETAEEAIAAMPRWQPIVTAPETDLGKTVDVLLYGAGIGVQSGSLGNYGGLIWANIANLHGNAVEYWSITHWMPLPAAPAALKLQP
jgi:hypothetical protein